MIHFKTTLGEIQIELDPKHAPLTAQNFLEYVTAKFYDGLIFHRVIPGFVIQGGGFDAQMQQRATRHPIANESDNGLKNVRGSLSMARTSDPHSATAQFFINLVDNPSLDHQPGRPGYAVFARVAEGMQVVDQIAAQPTGQSGPHSDVPVTPIVIERAWHKEQD